MAKKKIAPFRDHKTFRDIPIFPENEDVNCARNPILESNIVNGEFDSVDEYLDIHFRLNREDFIRPFRDGIKEYRRAIKRGKDINDLKNIRIYTGVRILKYEHFKGKVHAYIKFDTTNLKHFCWHVTKRLIYGSLVCLTANNFYKFCFATVCKDRDLEELSKGKIWLEIRPDVEEDDFFELYDSQKSLTMAESVEFFEYYRHALQALQNFREKTFPFTEYIIQLSRNIKIAPYLTESSLYNLSFLSVIMPQRVNNFMNKLFLENIDILNADNWPHNNLLDFDEFQYESFKHALTKQLAIIQGPPGTGKTFAGLRIAQSLLQNKQIWNNEIWKSGSIRNSKSIPIVIVAKTNHALDQFLEGLVPYCQNEHRLIRIGCQSKSEILKKYDLDHYIELRPDSLFAKYSLTDIHQYYQSIIDRLKYHFMTANEIKFLDKSKHGDFISQLNKYDDNIFFALIKWLIPSLSVELKPLISEKYESIEINGDINDDIEEMIDSGIIEDFDYNLSKENNYDNIADYLLSLFRNLCISDKEKADIQKIVEKELKSKDVMKETEAYFVHDIMLLSFKDRWRLYRLWVRICIDEVRHELNETDTKYREEVLEYNKYKRELIEGSGCDIIGLTTTGAAKNRDMISKLNPLIVIIEEAAEVLESHVVSALTEKNCHLILIGDHQQLRPNPRVHELAVDKHLDVSMFERLIRNRLPYCQLKVQHRMCPLISSLLVPHFYDELVDHESVTKYKTIRGVCKHVYFINHNQPESMVEDSTSKMNRFEAEFIARLCKYLVQQEYSQSQITILTMYSAQCFHLRNILKQCKPSLSKVRVAVVDNFQGEENEIILLSFVRSNSKGDIGFVKNANRINVALSRAKRGMYCIGNFDCLAQKTKLWKNLKADFIAKGIFGSSLEIFCQNHPNRKISVSKASDFDKVSEGGCGKRCKRILKCKHKCPVLCHSYDKLHESIACRVHCAKVICDLKHKCENLCHFGKNCGKCFKSVPKKIPKCGHKVSMPCCYDPTEYHCREKCHKRRSCGHRCRYSCGYICDQFPCKVKIELKLECGHMNELRCSDDISIAFCSKGCQKIMNFGQQFGYKWGKEYENKSLNVALNPFSSLF